MNAGRRKNSKNLSKLSGKEGMGGNVRSGIFFVNSSMLATSKMPGNSFPAAGEAGTLALLFVESADSDGKRAAETEKFALRHSMTRNIAEREDLAEIMVDEYGEKEPNTQQMFSVIVGAVLWRI
ncbi:hypothetical protein KSP40_PGU007811 [Platanthera guangdongensis]|uniref:Uncharacterized protein n=1 Tax=Platanthera guangdongensis TaxID=2320717 RepID=A0ABR2LV59_9ASPA